MAGQPGPASAFYSSSRYVGHGAGGAAPLKNDTEVILKGAEKWQELQVGPWLPTGSRAPALSSTPAPAAKPLCGWEHLQGHRDQAARASGKGLCCSWEKPFPNGGWAFRESG